MIIMMITMMTTVIPFSNRIKKVMSQATLSYSLLIMLSDRIYAVRDPFGNRPLCIGKLLPAIAFTGKSEPSLCAMYASSKPSLCALYASSKPSLCALYAPSQPSLCALYAFHKPSLCAWYAFSKPSLCASYTFSKQSLCAL